MSKSIATEPYLPVNPCEGCAHSLHCRKDGDCVLSRTCMKFHEYKGGLAAIETVLEYLIAHPSTLSDSKQFVYTEELESMLVKVREAKR